MDGVIQGNCSSGVAIIKIAEPNKDCDLFLCSRREGVECDYAVDLDQSQGLISEFEEDHGRGEKSFFNFLVWSIMVRVEQKRPF